MHEEKKVVGGESDERNGKRGNNFRNKLLCYRVQSLDNTEDDEVIIIT